MWVSWSGQALIKTVSCVCLTFKSKFSRVQGIFHSQLLSITELWCHMSCGRRNLSLLHKRLHKIKIFHYNSIKRCWMSFALECFGRDQDDTVEFMLVAFHSTFYHSRSDFGFHIFPSPCLYISCVAIVSHTFLPSERPERVPKWLNTWKYSERTRRSVRVRRSTWRDWKTVDSRLVGWIFFCIEEDNKKKNQTAELCKKI